MRPVNKHPQPKQVQVVEPPSKTIPVSSKKTRQGTWLLLFLLLIVIGYAILNSSNFQDSEGGLQATAIPLEISTTNETGNLPDELRTILSQAIPSTPLDENSIITRVANQVTANLPPSITQVVKETTIAENSLVPAYTTETLKIEAGGKLSYQDETGTAFITFGGSPKVTIEEPGIFNILGTFLIDNTEIEVTADELNDIDNLTEDIEYLVVDGNDALDKERILSAGQNISFTDEGAGKSFTIALDLNGVDYTWPSSNGTANQYLQTNGSGTLSWAAITSLGVGNAVDSGTVASVLFVDSNGNLAEDNTNFQWVDASNRLAVPEVRAISSAGLKLYEDGGSGIFVEDGGNVGIGTANPVSILEIAGSGHTLRITDSADSYNPRVWLGDSSGNGGFLDLYDESEVSQARIRSYAVGGIQAYFTAGNVGIGTTAPNVTLDVTGEIAASNTIHATSSLETSGTILSAGDVGIGTATPSDPLHINTSDDAISGANVDVSELTMRIGNLADLTGQAVGLGFGVSAAATNVGAAIIHEREGAQSFGKLHFATKESGAAQGADIPIRMTIDDNGNVGIGTTAPSEVLEVNGRIRMATWTADGDTAIYKDDPTGNVGVQASDIRLKKNFTPLDSSLNIISQITPYFFHTINQSDTDKKRLGIIAQDVLPTLPELTFKLTHQDSDEEYYGVHYDKLPVLLLGGLQEQQLQINSLADLLGTDLTAVEVNSPTDSTQTSPLTLSILDRLEALETLVEETGLQTVSSTSTPDITPATQADSDSTLDLSSTTLDGLEVQGHATIFGDLDISGNATVQGTFTRSNEQLGTTYIPDTVKSVKISFDQPFDTPPHVTVNSSIDYVLDEITNSSFTISFPTEHSAIDINWLAISVPAQDHRTEIIESFVETALSSPSPTPSPTPQSSPTPTPTPSPTSDPPTPPPSPNPSPSPLPEQ